MFSCETLTSVCFLAFSVRTLRSYLHGRVFITVIYSTINENHEADSERACERPRRSDTGMARGMLQLWSGSSDGQGRASRYKRSVLLFELLCALSFHATFTTPKPMRLQGQPTGVLSA